MNGSKLAFAICIVMLPAGLAGCAGILPQTTTPELPAILQYVFDNAGLFGLLDEAALDRAPAAVADASDLAGCWGQVAEQTTRDLVGVGDVAVQVFEVYHFDPETGTATFEVYFQDSTGAISVTMTGTGTFSVSEAGRLEINLTNWSGQDASTGQALDVSAESSTSALEAERGGDYLVLTPTAESVESGATPDSVTFLRFACP